MYINLDKEYLEENMKKANDEAKSVMGDEGDSSLLFPNLVDSVDDFEIQDDTTLNVSFSNDLGYFNFKVKLDLDDLAKLMEILSKKVNKIKTILEASGLQPDAVA